MKKEVSLPHLYFESVRFNDWGESIGLISLAHIHLLTHALFRALLSVCAGVIIHTKKDSQDIRFMANLSIQIPFNSVWA
jgi:NADH:ubiquinone oxidoreductase subunit 5 (subunit L)/multisubunit Na+/H+ antiporter MnhA subunit